MNSEYIENLLAPRLKKLGANDSQIELATADVRNRLASVLRHWSDNEFTRTLLEVGMEEASRYTPHDSDIVIRSLVVLAVRNSLIEDMATTRPFRKEFQSDRSPIISDADMPILTQEAIQSLGSAHRQGAFQIFASASEADIFKTLQQKYPVTWNAFHAISQIDGGEKHIQSIDAPAPNLNLPDTGVTQNEAFHFVTSSGIDPRVDCGLAKLLRGVYDGPERNVFFPALKWLTRNTEKLFQVFEFILCRGSQIVTLNYCFSRTSICKRQYFVTPPHYTSEIAARLNDTGGLCKQHREALNYVRSQL